MNIFKIIFLASVIAFSSLSYSASSDIIHSSAYLSGTVKAFYISFEIKLRDNDSGKGPQEPYGKISLKNLNGKDVDLVVWDVSESNHLETNTVRVHPSSPFITSELKENYITLTGDISDYDSVGSNDHLCTVDSKVKIYQSDVGKEFNKNNDGIFYGGGDCIYLKLTRFELVK